MKNLNKQNTNYPKGWNISTLEDTCEIILGQSPPSSTYNTSKKGLPFFQGKTEFGPISPTPEKWCSKPIKISLPKDILISVRAPVGPTNISIEECCIGRGLAAIRAKESLNYKYLFYYLRYIENSWSEKATGTTFKAISGETIRKQLIPLPELNEQLRIVEHIEKLFTQLDAGTTGLKRAQAALKRYRASVLKAACEGRLVPQDPNDEPAKFTISQLGKKALPFEDHYKLPANWCWVKLGDLVESFKNGIYKPAEYYSSDGVACLRMYNIEGGEIIWKDIKRMVISQEEKETYRLNPGDILVNRVNSRELVGKAAVIHDFGEPVIFESKNIRLKIIQKLANSNYINYYFEGNRQQYFNFNAQQVVGMASINQRQISQMPIPLPPINEQNRIVEEVEYKISSISKVENIISKSIQQASRLRMTILNMAFEGKLD